MKQLQMCSFDITTNDGIQFKVQIGVEKFPPEWEDLILTIQDRFSKQTSSMVFYNKRDFELAVAKVFFPGKSDPELPKVTIKEIKKKDKLRESREELVWAQIQHETAQVKVSASELEREHQRSCEWREFSEQVHLRHDSRPREARPSEFDRLHKEYLDIECEVVDELPWKLVDFGKSKLMLKIAGCTPIIGERALLYVHMKLMKPSTAEEDQSDLANVEFKTEGTSCSVHSKLSSSQWDVVRFVIEPFDRGGEFGTIYEATIDVYCARIGAARLSGELLVFNNVPKPTKSPVDCQWNNGQTLQVCEIIGSKEEIAAADFTFFERRKNNNTLKLSIFQSSSVLVGQKSSEQDSGVAHIRLANSCIAKNSGLPLISREHLKFEKDGDKWLVIYLGRYDIYVSRKDQNGYPIEGVTPIKGFFEFGDARKDYKKPQFSLFPNQLYVVKFAGLTDPQHRDRECNLLRGQEILQFQCTDDAIHLYDDEASAIYICSTGDELRPVPIAFKGLNRLGFFRFDIKSKKVLFRPKSEACVGKWLIDRNSWIKLDEGTAIATDKLSLTVDKLHFSNAHSRNMSHLLTVEFAVSPSLCTMSSKL